MHSIYMVVEHHSDDEVTNDEETNSARKNKRVPKKVRSRDGDALRHLAYSLAWKTSDSQHTSFNVESRNMHPALASDEFNPY